ncbi:MAG: hypothetical protein OEY11_05880 [Gammaproteobacteria bacterium]|nr:hypothetical protein [Gammaproteobacteria bacterium]
MRRQVYFLLADSAHTKEVCNELKEIHIPDKNIHAVVNENKNLEFISDVRTVSEPNHDAALESNIWKLNLIVFCLAFTVFLAMLISESFTYIIAPVIVMLATFISALYFIEHIPNVHWNEFISAIHHGEILLIVDVPKKSIPNLNQRLHEHHPELLTGGSCWKL